MSSFGIYLIGFIVLSIGILMGASILGVGNQWIAVIGLVLLGLGAASPRRAGAMRLPPASRPASPIHRNQSAAPARFIATSSSIACSFAARSVVRRMASCAMRCSNLAFS